MEVKPIEPVHVEPEVKEKHEIYVEPEVKEKQEYVKPEVKQDVKLVPVDNWTRAQILFKKLLNDPEFYWFRICLDIAAILLCLVLYYLCRKPTIPDVSVDSLKQVLNNKQRESDELNSKLENITQEYIGAMNNIRDIKEVLLFFLFLMKFSKFIS